MRRVSVALSFVLAACHEAPAPSAPAPLADTVNIAVLAGPAQAAREGEAGVRRLALARQRLGALARPSLLLVVGDSLAPCDSGLVGDGALPSAERLASFLSTLRPSAVLRGPSDLGLGKTDLQELAEAARLPILSTPRNESTPRRIDNLLVVEGGLRIGVLGAPGSARAEIGDYVASALALRAQKADVVIALVPESFLEARDFAGALARIDVAVTSGGALDSPRVARGTLWVEPPPAARGLGVLRLHPKRGGPWVYDERGDEPMPPPEVPESRSITWVVEPLGGEAPISDELRALGAGSGCAQTF